MTDAREEIRDIICDHVDIGHSPSPYVAGVTEAADAILSALPSIVREMIPDLEWGFDKGVYYAGSVFGEYNYTKVNMNIDDGFLLFLSDVEVSSENYVFDAIARRKANEHHKQQILKAMGMSE